MNSSTTTPPPTGQTTANGDQKSGQLIIKAQLGDDIRKMMIHNEDLTLNELLLMLERIFAGKISNSDEITIKYVDEDGDKITLLNDTDLTVALHFHKLLRLFVFVNGQEQPTTGSTNTTETNEKTGHLIDAKTFRSELQQIRNAVQTILDRLQLPAETTQDKEVTNSSCNASIGIAPAPPQLVRQPLTAFVSSTTREFDPIKNATQFEPPQQRSTTPDSIRSKSSTSHLSGQNEQKTFVPPTNAAAPTESLENQHAPPPSNFGQTQMPTPHFAPPTFANQSNNEQQLKSNAFGPPPTTGFPGMNAGPPRFPNAFQGMTSAPPSAFNPNTATPPPPSTVAQMPGQHSSFIGQQQQQQPLAGPPPSQQQQQYQQQQQQQQQHPSSYFNPQSAAPPPAQGGLFQQQAAFQQQRPPPAGFLGSNPPPTSFGQPNATPLAPPPSSSSPAMITPSSIQPPPMATQQPYGYPPQNFYNQQAQYPKAN